MRQAVCHYAERAAVLMMPLVCAGHWTLLVVERAGMARPAAEPIEMPMGMTKGCSKRGTSGCKECAAAAADFGTP